MHTGSLKWFNEDKGFGFIKPDNGTNDIFLHITDLQKAGFNQIEEGQRLQFNLRSHRGRECACDLEFI